MLTRILTAVCALVLLVPALIWGGLWAAVAIFAVISGFSIFEMLGCCGLRKNLWISIPSILVSMLCAFIPPIFSMRLFGEATAILAIIVFALIYFMLVAVFAHKTVDIERVLMFFALAIYITAGFTALSLLRSLYGLWAVAFVLCIAWFTDTFAYFSGMLFGKRKLCPEISPKKTIAGAIGGTLFGTAIGIVIYALVRGWSLYTLVALPLSVLSQLGDLAASVIKRRFGVKDYGKIFPGHGGVLDRFDSVIPVSIMTAAFLLGYYVLVWVM